MKSWPGFFASGHTPYRIWIIIYMALFAFCHPPTPKSHGQRQRKNSTDKGWNFSQGDNSLKNQGNWHVNVSSLRNLPRRVLGFEQAADEKERDPGDCIEVECSQAEGVYTMCCCSSHATNILWFLSFCSEQENAIVQFRLFAKTHSRSSMPTRRPKGSPAPARQRGVAAAVRPPVSSPPPSACPVPQTEPRRRANQPIDAELIAGVVAGMKGSAVGSRRKSGIYTGFRSKFNVKRGWVIESEKRVQSVNHKSEVASRSRRARAIRSRRRTRAVPRMSRS